MIIRDALPTDAGELWRLNERFNGPGTNDPDAVQRALQTGSELVCVAEEDGRLVGFVCGQIYRSLCYPEPCAELTELYVEEAYRRRGAATALVSALRERFRAGGAKSYQLLTGADNRAAQLFYKKMGLLRTDEIQYRDDLT